MKNYKYLSTTIFLAGLTSSLLAAPKKQAPIEQPPCSKTVTLQSPDYTFEINFAALILKPFANNMDYGAEALPFNYGDSQPAISPSWDIKEISPEFHFGFDLEIAAIFHKSDSSLMLNWERYHTPKDSSSFTVPDTSLMIGPFFEIGPDASSYKKAKGTNRFEFDEASLDYGTFVKFGKLLRMNLFAGVGFARIVQHRSTTFSDMAGTITRTIQVPAKFIGAGPQLGLDFTYSIFKGLRFVGDAQATLFVGSFKNHTNYSTDSQDLVTLGDTNPNLQSTKVHKKMGVVPGLEGKLGLAYAFTFCNKCMFELEAGYQAQIYLNSIRSIDMGSEVALGSVGSIGSSTTGVYARTFERTVSDFGMAGPYVAVSVGF